MNKMTKFVIFLEANGAKKAFFKNFRTTRGLKFNSSEHMIGLGSAFVWSETQEGTGYWSKLSKEWGRIRDNSEAYFTLLEGESLKTTVIAKSKPSTVEVSRAEYREFLVWKQAEELKAFDAK